MTTTAQRTESPRSPRAFAKAALALIAEGLTEDREINDIRADVAELVQAFEARDVHLVTKANAKTRMVYGWASVVTKDGEDVEDLQGDIMDVDNLRDVVHDFVRESRVGKAMHSGPQIGEVLDTFVFDKAVQSALGIDFGCEGWLVGVYVPKGAKGDGILKRIEDGELSMFSIAGIGEREPLTLTGVGKYAPDDPIDYAYVGDRTSSSTWKLPIHTPRHAAAAAAALGPKGYRGEKVKIPSSALPHVKAKVRAAYRRHFPDTNPSEYPEGIR